MLASSEGIGRGASVGVVNEEVDERRRLGLIGSGGMNYVGL